MQDDIEWRVEPGLTGYDEAVAFMEARAAAIRDDGARELVWLVEHPPLYTAGTSADAAELLDARFPVFKSGRGGRHTYHGPGQRVGYLMIDIGKRGRDVRLFVHSLEAWMASTLGRLGVPSYAVPGRVGLWTRAGGAEAKIGAIGVRVRRWVTLHGFSVNIDPDLSHFGGIVPCGLPEFPVTSLSALGKGVNMATFDAALALEFPAFIASLAVARSKEGLRGGEFASNV